jgi:uncharacterized OsmC-like protein/pimeloyl-ACP methyl ester carboxylesterase
MPSRRERLTFRGSMGDHLDARLDLPGGEPTAYALFAHCFTCSKDVAAATAISAGLVDRGVGVLRFDFTGLGSSGGEFANTDFSSNVDDLVAAADTLRERHRAPALLVGHSLGGAAMLSAAARIPEALAVATVGAPFDPAHVTQLFPDDALRTIQDDGETELEIAGRRFTIRRRLLEDLGAQRMEQAIRGLARPLLVMHSPLDNIVGVDNARRIFDCARHPKSFVSLDSADHLLTDRSDGAYAAMVLAAWASRYLPPPADGDPDASDVDVRGRAVDDGPDGADEDGPGRADEDVRVHVGETGEGRFTQRILVRGHQLSSDEPIGLGDDEGPTPYDLLLAALGACTSMTLRMYADRAGLPLDQVSVTLQHDRGYATDCAEAPVKRCLVDHVTRTLHLEGPTLTDEQRSKLLEIADRCPVHRTLVGDVRIRTSIVAAPPG